MDLELTTEQKTAIKSLFDWYTSENKKYYITLGGYAGTGKTTLLSVFRKLLYRYEPKLNIAFCSYTGKATQVLKNKLINESSFHKKDTVSTIHSLIYSPKINIHEEIVGWVLKDSISYDLIIVDEASMIDATIWQDLSQYKIPIIAVGDHGQLPPIEGNFNLMEKPDIKLEQIHRQAKDNPIIKLSIIARMDGFIQIGNYGKNVEKFNAQDQFSQDFLDNILEDIGVNTLLLVGYNRTRINLNNYVRTKKFIESKEPQIGDRVICLRNNHKLGIYNGMLGSIIDIHKNNKEWFLTDIQMDEGINYHGLIYADQFNQKNSLSYSKSRKETKIGDLFDFGYSLTVHKAQGSEAEKVIVFEERNKHMSDEQWKRWLYTAITRSKKELYIFGHDTKTVGDNF